MGRWNSKEITELAKSDFEKAWKDSASMASGKGAFKKSPRKGSQHPVFETMQKLREAYLALGFREAINPTSIDEVQVKKQFGPEASAVLDRCYYLGGLPRPNVGVSDEKLGEIKKLSIEVEKGALQGVLHEYKKGAFGGDDLIYKLAETLGTDDSKAMQVLNEVFPEFLGLDPEASKTTLRSHMTSGWFLTLESLVPREQLPLRLFSIDRCFRREQREDEGHLRTYHSASCVIADSDASVEDGKEVASGLLSAFGFEELRFEPDEKRSKYYAPGTQTEVYMRGKNGKWIEIATFGMYSPVALSRYKVEVPVMNLGLGVERLAMLLSGKRDVRELVMPQFHGEWRLDDDSIASMLYLDRVPTTSEGREIARKIVEFGMEKGSEVAPCAFEVYSGKVLDTSIVVKLVEVEEGKRLLGPATLNEIYVHGGNIMGVPPEKGFEEVKKEGTKTGISYLSALANLAAHEIERAVLEGEEEVKVRTRIVRGLGDVNLRLDESALRYITTNNKLIDVRGPVFMTVEAEKK